MNRINFIRWKRPVMPTDFNNIQNAIEETQKSLNKNIIGCGLMSGGDILLNPTTKTLSVNQFIGFDNLGNLLKSDANYSLDITPYLNENNFFSVVAVYEKKYSGEELDFDNELHHYKELDYFQIFLKPGDSSFPIITDNELLLGDVQFLESGAVLIKTNRVKKLIKIADCLSATDITSKDNAILQNAKNYADIIGNGLLSIQGLSLMGFDNIVTNGDFSSGTNGWTARHSNPIQVINGDNDNGIFGNILKITRTNADSQKLVLSSVLNTKLIVGKEIYLRAKLKMDEGLGNSNNNGIRIILVGLDENNTVINSAESITVDNSNWTGVNVNLEILPECKSVGIQVELDFFQYIGYIAEVSANYGTTAIGFSKSMNEWVTKILEIEARLEADIINLGKLNTLYDGYLTTIKAALDSLITAYINHVHTALNTKPTAYSAPVT